MIFELALDFHGAVEAMPRDHPKHRMLELLEEAIRRDIHFIARHPTTLFQSMWNLCWWSDCPEVAKYYQPPEAGSQDAETVSDKPAPRLSLWMEHWRNERRGRLIWIRSLRPPQYPVGTGHLSRFRGQEGFVRSVAISRDGLMIASGGGDAFAVRDRTVRIRDAITGKVRVCLVGHEGCVNSLSFDPTGRLIATGSADRTVRLWDVVGGAEIFCLRGHEAAVSQVRFSPDGQRLLYICGRALVIRDAFTGDVVGKLDGPAEAKDVIAFSSDGRRVVSHIDDESLLLWVPEATERMIRIRGHLNDEDYIFDGQWDGFFDVGKEISCLAFDSQGSRLVGGAHDGHIWVWNVSDGEQVCSLVKNRQMCAKIAFTADSQRIFCAQTDGTVRMWDILTKKEVTCMRWHEAGVTSIAVSSDGAIIVTGSIDGTVCLWKTAGLTWIPRLRGEWCAHREMDTVDTKGDGTWVSTYATVWHPTAKIERLAVSSDGRRIIESIGGRVWDAQSGEFLEGVQGESGGPEAAGSPVHLPFEASRRAEEMVIQVATTDMVIGWFPTLLDNLSPYPDGRAWAGSIENHLTLIRLEDSVELTS